MQAWHSTACWLFKAGVVTPPAPARRPLPWCHPPSSCLGIPSATLQLTRHPLSWLETIYVRTHECCSCFFFVVGAEAGGRQALVRNPLLAPFLSSATVLPSVAVQSFSWYVPREATAVLLFPDPVIKRCVGLEGRSVGYGALTLSTVLLSTVTVVHGRP